MISFSEVISRTIRANTWANNSMAMDNFFSFSKIKTFPVLGSLTFVALDINLFSFLYKLDLVYSLRNVSVCLLLYLLHFVICLMMVYSVLISIVWRFWLLLNVDFLFRDLWLWLFLLFHLRFLLSPFSVCFCVTLIFFQARAIAVFWLQVALSLIHLLHLCLFKHLISPY